MEASSINEEKERAKTLLEATLNPAKREELKRIRQLFQFKLKDYKSEQEKLIDLRARLTSLVSHFLRSSALSFAMLRFAVDLLSNLQEPSDNLPKISNFLGFGFFSMIALWCIGDIYLEHVEIKSINARINESTRRLEQEEDQYSDLEKIIEQITKKLRSAEAPPPRFFSPTSSDNRSSHEKERVRVLENFGIRPAGHSTQMH